MPNDDAEWVLRSDLTHCTYCGLDALIETAQTPNGVLWLCRTCDAEGDMEDADAPSAVAHDAN